MERIGVRTQVTRSDTEGGEVGMKFPLGKTLGSEAVENNYSLGD